MRIAGTLALALLALAVAAPGSAITKDPAPRVADVLIPYHDSADAAAGYLRAGERSPADAAALDARLGGGHWQTVWNTVTGTAHAIYGSALRVTDGPFAGREEVDASARAIIHAHRDILGTVGSTLILDTITHANRKWYVLYQQVVDGVPVFNSYLRLQFTEDGRLIYLGSDFLRATEPPPAVVAAAEAAAIARRGVGAGEIDDRGEILVPVPGGELGPGLRRAYDVTVNAGPADAWRTFVDAETGEVLRRANEVDFVALTGHVSGIVDDFDPCDGPQITGDWEDLRVTVTDVGSTNTDETGNYSIDIPDGLPHPVVMVFNGLHARVDNVDSLDARFDGTGTPGTPLDVLWNDSNGRRSERDCWFHQNRIYDYFKAIGINLVHMEGNFLCNVEINNSCNAFYNGSSINFYKAGGGCANTGWLGDVIYHEYGHGINDATWGFSFPLIGALSEGYADVADTEVTNDSRIGHGFYEANCFLPLRDCLNALRYPQDVTGQAHNDGRIICGFSWDAGQALITAMGSGPGQAHWDSLATFSRFAQPNTMPDMVTQWFIEDDDDGVLNNGTPRYTQICLGATNHGFACPTIFAGVLITHTPLNDTNDPTGPYNVVATIGTTHPSGLDSTYLFYSINMGAFTAVPMTPTGPPSEYAAAIPGQLVGTLVRYYILGHDRDNFRATSPFGAPGVLHSMVVGQLTKIQDWKMEADESWTRGDQAPQLPDNATAGLWARVDPIGVFVFVSGNQVQVTPEDDHTADPATMCWVTEQEVVGQQAGSHDVDGGKTTLRSPAFSLSGIQFARVRYFRWFTNNLGANRAEDRFSVGISTDGGTSYTAIEETFVSNPSWFERRWDINNLVPLGSNLRLRFVARDSAGASLVEAALDDVTIEKWPPDLNAVTEQPAGSVPFSYALAQNNPNPFNPVTAIEYSVAERGRVSLRIYNVAGQAVRTLVDGMAEPGAYSVAWDGRDDAGRLAASGVYYYRVEAQGFDRTRKMVLLK